MAGGGLYDPLGTDPPLRAPRAGPSLSLIVLLVVLIGLAGLFAASAFRDSGERGQPRAVAEIGPVRPSDPPPSPPLSSAGPATLPAALPGGSVPPSDQEVEIQNGVRVIRLRHDGSTGGSLVVKVPEAAAAAAAVSSGDISLQGPSSSGPLPKMGMDGRRAAEAYAGAVVPGSKGKPWVAIVVEGLGLGAAGTAPAPTDWPVAVTLGFGVDGTEQSRQVAKARAAGHEVVLMLPSRDGSVPAAAMASVNGSNALPARDRLHWLLSRFTGYAGVIVDPVDQNAASVAADVLEMTRRGLYVVDGTAASAGVAKPTVPSVASPMAKADLVLAGPAETEALERFLDRLETVARTNGSAIGIAPASPRSLAAISRLTTTLADSGMALVPLGAVVNLRRDAQARPISVAAP